MCNCNCCNNEEEYEEFVPKKEYPIGGFFKIGKEVFKVVHGNSCLNCEFYYESLCDKQKCSPELRIDENNVIFTLYDTLED